ncbi:hypothetical protein V6Z11_D07G133100 [Gossypium hirsutum]
MASLGFHQPLSATAQPCAKAPITTEMATTRWFRQKRWRSRGGGLRRC